MTDHAARIAAIACTALAVDTSARAHVEAALRRELGGCRISIPRDQPNTGAQLAEVNAGLRARKPVAVIAQELGCSRTTIYRLLKRRKSHPAATV